MYVRCAQVPFPRIRPEAHASPFRLHAVKDIWVPLKTAREIAAELGVLDELSTLLAKESRAAYTVEDRTEGGLVHK